MSNETVKLNVSVGLSYIAASHRQEEIDTGVSPDEWDEMSEEEQEKLGQELYDEWLSGYLDGSWSVAE